MGTKYKKRLFFIKGLHEDTVFFIKGQHHPKSVFNLGPKVGPGLNKKKISIRFFIPGFQCQMENNKTQRGGARSAPPLWGGAEGAALLHRKSTLPNESCSKVRCESSRDDGNAPGPYFWAEPEGSEIDENFDPRNKKSKKFWGAVETRSRTRLSFSSPPGHFLEIVRKSFGNRSETVQKTFGNLSEIFWKSFGNQSEIVRNSFGNL